LNPRPQPLHAEFVLANTALNSPPLVPEILLRLAIDVIPLWKRAELQGTADSPPPFWAFAWPGGQALARYILDNAGDFYGKTVLDFGAGSGLVGIAASKAGAQCVCAEIDLIGIAAIEANARANKVNLSCIKNDIIGCDDGWDIICFGDVCYEQPLAESVTRWAASLSERGARVLLGDPGRDYFSEANLLRLATYTVPTSHGLEDSDRRETSVYTVKAQA